MKNKKNHMKRMLMLSLLTSACCIHSYATINEFTLMKETESVESILQNKRISGVVNDNFGPVIGANVSIKGTTMVPLQIWTENSVLMHRKTEPWLSLL